MTELGFKWDVPSGRFVWTPSCPYPDCGGELADVPERSVLGWCARCERPYEVEKVDVEGGGTATVHHRPDTAYCVRTGRRLVRLSVLDWCEAGGEPGRSNSLEDLRGEVFDAPGQHRSLKLERGWTQPLGKGSGGDGGDLVSSVSVIRGHVVAVTLGGKVGLLDATTGESRLTELLRWPGLTTDPADSSRRVRFPPAFRGCHGVLVAGHEAQFVDLQGYLFRGRGVKKQWRTVKPAEGNLFLGPPLGAASDRGLFCLLEGGESNLEGATLRFFGVAGEEEGHQEVPNIALPPVMERTTGRVIWLDRRGGVHWFGPPGSDLAAGASSPRLPLSLSPTLQPLLLALSDGSGRTELWLASKSASEEVIVHQALMNEVEAGAPWEWGSLPMGRLGEVNGFAVGMRSRYPANATSWLMALSTNDQVVSMERTVSERTERPLVQAPSAIGAIGGSHDPPIVTSAGVLSRIQGSLVLDTQGLGWRDDIHRVPVVGPYPGPQGIAIFGRRVYIGRRLSIDSFSVIVDGRGQR